MSHNRKLVLGGASLTQAKCNRHTADVGNEVRDGIEQLMISTGYLQSAPFKWIGLILRFGLCNDSEPHYQDIDKKDGELPLAIELDTHELRDADREKLKRLFTLATLKALIHAGHKYNLPTGALEARKMEIESLDASV
jgi:hypothetical protein